jgi:hypothetical protein
MDITKIKIKSSGEIIEPKGYLYFNDGKIGYDIPLSNLEVVDDNYVNIKDVANWIRRNFDLEKYMSSIFSGVGSFSFDIGRFIVDLEKGLKNGNKDK